MVVRRRLAVGGLSLAWCAAAVACGSFGGSDRAGGGDDGGGGADGGLDGAPPATGDASGEPDASDGGAVDASFDACVTFVVPATADTYLVNDVNHCNGAITFGNASPLQLQASVPAEVALVRFSLTNAQASLIDPTAKITVSTSGAVCGGGTCAGSAFAMRSDWAEASGDSHGADYCRRDYPSFGWSAGIGQPIAAPADYDTNAAGTMSFAAGTWRSGPLQPTALAGRLAGDGSAGYGVSLLLTVASPTSPVTFPAHDVDGGMTMTVTRCE